MSTRTDEGWTTAEEESLRTALLERQDAMDVGRAPWGALERRHRVAAQRRRVRRVAVGLAVVAVAAAAGTVAPWPGRLGSVLPATQVPVPPADTGTTVGSLADDPAFLDGLRARLASGADAGVPAGTRAADIRILLATDVAGARLALVHWPGGPSWTWVLGPEGGRLQDMRAGNSCTPTEVCWMRYGQGWTSWADQKPDGTVVPVGRPGDGAIVAAPAGSEVVVGGGNDVTAAGELRPLTVRAQERWPGIFVAPVTIPPVRMDVSVTPRGGLAATTWDASGSGLAPDEWWLAATRPAGAPAARGTQLPSVEAGGGDIRGDLVMAGARAAGTGAGDGSRARVVWAGRSGDTARALIAYGTASGGWVRVGVERVVAAGGFTLPVYGPVAVAADALDSTGAAWRSTDGSLVVVGPAQARSFRWVGGDGRPSGDAVALDPGGASVGATAPAGVTGVEFAGADGTAIGRADVAAVWPDGKVLS